jgi:ribosomal protein L6P/L9E
MSRVAKAPVALPKGVEVTLKGQDLQVKGSKGALALTLHELVEAKHEGEHFSVCSSPRHSSTLGCKQVRLVP